MDKIKLSEYLERSNGRYLPNGYYLKVETNADLSDLNKLYNDDKRSFFTFYHEYIHFIQDVSTTFGLLGMRILALKILDIKNTISKIDPSNAHLKLPIELNFSDIKLEVDAYKTAQGSGLIRDSRILKIISLSTTEECESGLKKVQVIYSDYNQKEETFDFGAKCIMESMAYILQSKFDEDYTPNSDIPYFTVEKIAEYLYNGFDWKKEYLVAICDLSLMSINPGLSFIEIISKLKEKEIVVKHVRDIYTYFYNDKAKSIYIDLVDHFCETIGVLFSEENFKLEVGWIRHVTMELMKLRGSFLHFIPSLILDDEHELFVELFRDIGTPFMSNNAGDGWFYNNLIYGEEAVDKGVLIDHKENFIPSIFVALNQVLSHLTNGTSISINTNCELFEICKNKNNELPDITSDNCRQPWNIAKKASENKDQLCPYAGVWKLLGLTEYTIDTN